MGDGTSSQTNRLSIAYLISSRLAMRTIAPINSGFLLSIALLILCLACAHANGEVNSKELLDDAGLDLETNDVESTSAIATQTTHAEEDPDAGEIDDSQLFAGTGTREDLEGGRRHRRH